MEIQSLLVSEGDLQALQKQGQSKTEKNGDFLGALMALLGPDLQSMPGELADNINLQCAILTSDGKSVEQNLVGNKPQSSTLQQIFPKEVFPQIRMKSDGVAEVTGEKKLTVQQQPEFQKALASIQEKQQAQINTELKGTETGEKAVALAEEVNKLGLKLEKQRNEGNERKKEIESIKGIESIKSNKDVHSINKKNAVPGIALKNSEDLQEQEIKQENVLTSKIKGNNPRESQQMSVEDGKETMTGEKNEVTINGKNVFQVTTEEIMNAKDSKKIATKMTVKELPEKLPELVKTQVKLLNMKDDNKDITIQLEPKELGKTIVKLTAQEGVVTVKILAEHANAKNIIEQGVQQLKQSLAEQGVKYGRVEVELAGQFLDQGQHQQFQGQHNKHYRNTGTWNIEDYYEEEDFAHESGVRGLTANLSVDYMA